METNINRSEKFRPELLLFFAMDAFLIFSSFICIVVDLSLDFLSNGFSLWSLEREKNETHLNEIDRLTFLSRNSHESGNR